MDLEPGPDHDFDLGLASELPDEVEVVFDFGCRRILRIPEPVAPRIARFSSQDQILEHCGRGVPPRCDATVKPAAPAEAHTRDAPQSGGEMKGGGRKETSNKLVIFQKKQIERSKHWEERGGCLLS